MRLTLLIALMFCLSGCSMQWHAPWPGAQPDISTENSTRLFDAAERCDRSAGDIDSVEQCIDLYEKVLAENPGHYQARVNAANLYILHGTAFARSSAEKSEDFLRAMRYSELAMYSNPDFKKRVDAGQRPWEAAEVLEKREILAMFFWATALQYEFKESMSLPRKVINVAWLKRALIFFNRIEQVAPDFGGGGVEFGKAICYFALPAAMGGSRILGDQFMEKAIEKGGESWLLPRWARGKYYYPLKGKKELARLDLVWVAAQSPEKFKDAYPWRIYFQSDARAQLR